MERQALIDLANRAGRASRLSGAPSLTAESPLSTLLQWLAWNDPNGVWRECESGECDECPRCRPLTVDDAWAALAEMFDPPAVGCAGCGMEIIACRCAIEHGEESAHA